MTEGSADRDEDSAPAYVAFAGAARIAEGDLAAAAAAARRALDADPQAAVLVFDGATAEVVDLDLRGSQGDIAARYPAPSARRGRPKLGVVAREVTLLPRHWDWLAAQPGGASVTLRRLVEAARKAEDSTGRSRARAAAAYRFMAAMAGDLPGFEEATRALFAGDLDGLAGRMADWPRDIRDQALRYAGRDR